MGDIVGRINGFIVEQGFLKRLEQYIKYCTSIKHVHITVMYR